MAFTTSHRVTEVAQYTAGNYLITTYDYSTPGRTVVNNPDVFQTYYTVDNLNRVTNAADAGGNAATTNFGQDSQVASTFNEMGGVTTKTYGANPGPNGMESLTQGVDPTGTTNSGSYANGTGCSSNNPTAANYLQATTTEPIAGATNNCYDTAGNPMSAMDPAGNMNSVTYNPDGTLLTSTTPANQAAKVTTNYTESYGHQTYYAAPSNGIGPDTVTLYDIWGNVAETFNFASYNYQTTSHDPMGRPLQNVTANGYNNGGTNTITYSHDPDGNVTGQTDNAGTTTTTYDGLSRPTALTAPSGANDTYTYDPASHLTALTNASGTTSYHYNYLNRLDQVLEPSGRYDILGYNPMGQQTDLWTNTGTAVSYSGDDPINLSDTTGLSNLDYSASGVSGLTRSAKVPAW